MAAGHPGCGERPRREAGPDGEGRPVTWQEYLTCMAETRGCVAICVAIEDFPPGWAQQLLAVLRESERELRAERELEAGL